MRFTTCVAGGLLASLLLSAPAAAELAAQKTFGKWKYHLAKSESRIWAENNKWEFILACRTSPERYMKYIYFFVSPPNEEFEVYRFSYQVDGGDYIGPYHGNLSNIIKSGSYSRDDDIMKKIMDGKNIVITGREARNKNIHKATFDLNGIASAIKQLHIDCKMTDADFEADRVAATTVVPPVDTNAANLRIIDKTFPVESQKLYRSCIDKYKKIIEKESVGKTVSPIYAGNPCGFFDILRKKYIVYGFYEKKYEECIGGESRDACHQRLSSAAASEIKKLTVAEACLKEENRQIVDCAKPLQAKD